MSGFFSWAMVGLGLGVVMVRRRSMAVGLITLQSLAIVALALRDAREVQDLIAAAGIAGRAVVLAVVFLLLISRTREARAVLPSLAPLRRGGLAVALALGLIWLLSGSGSGPCADDRGRAAISLIAFGLVTSASHRATVFQVLGIVLVENGLALVVLSMPGTSWLIELGVAFDLTLLGLVAGVFHERIFVEFGGGDTRVLRSLRD
jgi:hydrogenase-4 component E